MVGLHTSSDMKGHALCASLSLGSGRWLLDSRASHHMASTQSMFTSFESHTMSPILMGNNTYMSVTGKGSISFGDNTFQDVLCVPHLMNNLLSIYHITHGGNGRSVEFTLDKVIIKDLESRVVIATRVVDHLSWLYSFEKFSTDGVFVPTTVHHTSSVNHHSEEKFGYLNIAILTSDPTLEPFIPSPSSTVAVVDTFMTT